MTPLVGNKQMNTSATRHFADDAGLIHSGPHAGNDYTLCGRAMDGETGDEEMTLTNRRITCPDCIEIIDFCKGIRAAKINRPRV